MMDSHDRSTAKLKHVAAAVLVVSAVAIGATSTARAAWECPEVTATAGSCGQGICPEDGIQAADALKALQAAVGNAYCAACRCDTDNSGTVTASDASRILRRAVGQPVDLLCGQCNSLTLYLVDEVAGLEFATALQAETDPTTARMPFKTLGSATLSDGRIATLFAFTIAPWRTHFMVRDVRGDVLTDTILLDGFYVVHGLDCTAGSDRCVTSWKYLDYSSLVSAIINADAPTITDTIIVKRAANEDEDVAEITTGAGPYRIACDATGICVATWVLERRTVIFDEDFEDFEALGIFARAFNARTGELGSELFIDPTDPADFRTPSVVSLGGNRFSVTSYSGDAERTRVLDVR